jgi:hypothetical protein
VQKAPLAAVAAEAKDRQPLLDLVVSITMQFIEERQSRSISRDDALVLLEEQQLLVEPELYCFLNQKLRNVKVDYVLYNSNRLSGSAAYLYTSGFHLCALPAGQQQCTNAILPQ